VEEKEIREKNRKLRFLRYLVDFSVWSIQQDEVSLDQALKVVEDVKHAALGLFPDKEEAFELIYQPVSAGSSKRDSDSYRKSIDESSRFFS